MKEDKRILFNLVMMMLCWGSVSFSFFVLGFLIKYLPGDVYLNSIVSGFSAVAYLMSGPMKKKFDVKWILFISFTLALMSSVTLFFFSYW